MTTFSKSVLAWLAGGVVGALVAPNGKRMWGAVLGSVVSGAVIADPLLERARDRLN